MEIALTEFFCKYHENKKMPFSSLVTFIAALLLSLLHSTFLGEYGSVSESLAGSKMAIILELKFCLSNFSKRIERQEN